MKKMFLLLVALMGAAVSFAQSTLVVTLSHGDEITMYYGSGALGNAWSAAVSGDVINLSGGTFNLNNLTCNKAVTLRGTGIDASFPTTITGSFTLDIPDTDTCTMSMEGIRCDGRLTLKGTFEKVLFLKSKFSEINWQTTSTNKKDFKICNCKITSYCDINSCSTINFVNSFIRIFRSYSTGSGLFLNCLVGSYGYCKNASFVNSVVFGGSFVDAQTCIAMNSVSAHDSGWDIFTDMSTAKINCPFTTISNVFKSFRGSYSDGETFELTDEAKNTYIGTDGKEVGMYGGDLPYSSTPSYPQITKMNVANKTTADGKLSVEIEVSATE